MPSLLDITGTIALITSIIGLSPQVYMVYKTKSAGDISILMLINYLIGSIAWVLYGLETNSSFVLYSNYLGSGVTLLLIAQKIYYDKRQGNSMSPGVTTQR